MMASTQSPLTATPGSDIPHRAYPSTSDAEGAVSPKSLRFDPVETVHYPEEPNVPPGEVDVSSDEDGHNDNARGTQLTKGLVTQQQEPRPATSKHKSKKKRKKRKRRSFKDIRMVGSITLCGRVRLSRWIAISLVLLFISSVTFLVAFVTNGWGTLTVKFPRGQTTTVSWGETTDFHSPTPVLSQFVEPLATAKHEGAADDDWDDMWEFGLWQCCRESDGVCLGTRFPLFYSATRAFCVLALFGHCLSLAWLIGNSLEQLLDYDVCTLATLATLCFSSGAFVLVAVCCFGFRWPVDFKNEYYGTQPTLSFSYYLACISVPMTLAAGAFIAVDIYTGLKEIEDNSISQKEDEINIIDDQTLGNDQVFEDVKGYGATFKSGHNAEGSLEMVQVKE